MIVSSVPSRYSEHRRASCAIILGCGPEGRRIVRREYRRLRTAGIGADTARATIMTLGIAMNAIPHRFIDQFSDR